MAQHEEVKLHCAKTYLNHIRSLNKRVNCLQQEIESLRASAELTGISYSDKIKTQSSGDTLDNAVIKLQELIVEYCEELNNMLDVQRMAHQTLSKLSRAEYTEALTKYYIQGHSWERISVDMGYTFHHVMKIRKHALIETYSVLPEEWRNRPIPKAI